MGKDQRMHLQMTPDMRRRINAWAAQNADLETGAVPSFSEACRRLIEAGLGDDEIAKLADEIERLRAALRQCRGMADQGIDAPNAAYRWCERIEEVAISCGPLAEYEEWAHPKEDLSDD